MAEKSRLTLDWKIGTSLLGIAATGGLAMVANRFVDEFSRPHVILDQRFEWEFTTDVAEPETHYQKTIWFQTLDGILLSGEFWRQLEAAPTVVLCHGYRISSQHLRASASILYNLGYNVFMFDFRGHGASESVITSAGNVEVRDLQAAIDVARQQPETLPGQIIIFGFSMGAAIALLMPPDPDVKAIIADSPYAHSDDILRRLISWRIQETFRGKRLRWLPFVAMFIAWMVVVLSIPIFWLRFGHGFISHPISSFQKWKRRKKQKKQLVPPPILLIHCSGDSLIPIEHTRQIYQEARKHGFIVQSYFVDGGEHCAAYVTHPQRYKGVINAFIAQYVQQASSL